MLRYAYSKICEMYSYSAKPIRENMMREQNAQNDFTALQTKLVEEEKARNAGIEALMAANNLGDEIDHTSVLPPISVAEAYEKVQRQYGR